MDMDMDMDGKFHIHGKPVTKPKNWLCPVPWALPIESLGPWLSHNPSRNKQQNILSINQPINPQFLKPNTHRRRRRDETVLSRRLVVGGVYMNSQLARDDCRRIRRCERSRRLQVYNSAANAIANRSRI